MQGLGAIAAAVFFYIRKKRDEKKKMDELSVDWDQVEHFYNNGGEAISQHMVENEKYFPVEDPVARPSMTLSSPSIAIERYTPNVYDDDNFTKDSTTLASEITPKLGEESMTLMKPSIVEGNDERYVAAAAPPIVKLKPDIADDKK